MTSMKNNGFEAPIESTDDVDPEDTIPAPILERLEVQEKAARRRTLWIILAILLIGGAVIGAVVGISLSQKKSQPSLTPAPSTTFPSLAPTAVTVDSPAAALSPAVSPAAAPVASPAVALPTASPTMQPVVVVTSRPTAVTLVPTALSTPSPVNSPKTTEPTSSPTTKAPFTAAPVTASPTSSILPVLLSVALNGGEEFKNASSYQSKAYSALRLSNRTDDDWKVIQRYALACIYFSTYGVPNKFSEPDEDQWVENSKWLTAEEECNWYGIDCDSDDRVKRIALNKNGLTGSFPREVMLLNSTLRSLDIGDNNIHNEGLGVYFLGNLRYLSRLAIGNSFFEYDGLPPVLGKLTALEYLDVSYTRMLGAMRPQLVFANMRGLQELRISGLNFGSPIPSQISSLPNMTHLFSEDSNITGSMKFIMSMPFLKEIRMSNNPGFKGIIPARLGNTTTALERIFMSGCSLNGKIPATLDRLVNLQELWLNDNKFTGTIPTSLQKLDKLSALQLSGNNFTGALPAGLCNQTRTVSFEELCVECDTVTCCCCTCCKSDSCSR